MLNDPRGITAWPESMQRAAVRDAGGDRVTGPLAYGTSGWNAGPTYVDFDRTRRSPTPIELGNEFFRNLIYGCAVLNANAVARQILRLYIGTGHGQMRPKAFGPNSHLQPAPVDRLALKYLRTKADFRPWTKTARDIDEVTDHPLLDLFNTVNPAWDHIRLIRYIVLSLDTIGRSHLLPGDDTGNPTTGRMLPPWLWPLITQYVLPYRAQTGSLPTAYYYFAHEYAAEDVISFRCDSMRDPNMLGQSPAQASFAFMALQDRYTSSVSDIVTQTAKPGIILSNKDPQQPFGEPERRRLQNDVNYQLSAGGQGRALVVDGNVEIKTINPQAISLAENEIGETAIKYVLFTFGIPLSMLRNEDSNRAVSEAGHYQHAKLAVEPRCVNIASTLTKWTHEEGRRRGQDWSRLFWAFDNPVIEDREREAKICDMELKNGTKVINEVRQAQGLDAKPWGDKPWFPTTLAQISDDPAENAGGEAPDGPQGGSGDETDAAEQPDDTTDNEKTVKALNEQTAVLLARCEAELDEHDFDLKSLELDPIDRLDERIHEADTERKRAGRQGRKPRPGRDDNRNPKPGHENHPSGGKPGTGGHGDYDSSQHPHGEGGRFIETPNKPKPTADSKPKPRPSRYDAVQEPGLVAQKAASDRAEQQVAESLGATWVGKSDPQFGYHNNPPYDARFRLKGRNQFVEVKYKHEGSKISLSVHADAELRKADAVANHNGDFHTVLLDVRDRSHGGAHAEHYSGHDLYYKRGAGAFSTANMYRCKDEAELKRLMRMPEDQLPEKARGPVPVRTPKLEAQAKLVEESRKRRDDGGKKAERRKRWNDKQRALKEQLRAQASA